MAEKMNIKRYVPRYSGIYEVDDFSHEGRVYTQHGIVDVFTCCGFGKHGPLTTLNMYIHPHIYHVRLERSFHPRWLTRMGNQFASRCVKMAGGKKR